MCHLHSLQWSMDIDADVFSKMVEDVLPSKILDSFAYFLKEHATSMSLAYLA